MCTGGGVRWEDEAEVVIVGYGGAGAVTAIATHDAGAKVIILEKQPKDSPTQTNHTPNTRMSGGAWFNPTDLEETKLYLKGMIRIANEDLDSERKEMIQSFSQHLIDNTGWLKQIGIELAGHETIDSNIATPLWRGDGSFSGRWWLPDFSELPGSRCACLSVAKTDGKYRRGASFFKSLSEAVEKRNIPIMYKAPVRHLISRNGEIQGVIVSQNGRDLALRSSRGVVLTCGGFEFNNWMKENYLRVTPTYFTGNPGNTGDGITMTMEVGAALWHMNNAAWRVVMKFPEHPVAFSTMRHETCSIFVDRNGNRFTNERFKMHIFGYELTNYDGYAMCYPKVPCYWVFDEKRRALGPLASLYGASNPPGGIMGDVYYQWSFDNQREIERGWILKANSLDELATKIRKDPDNGGFMTASTLRDTVKRYNQFYKKGEDIDFGKGKEWLDPVEDPPFYAVKLWPGGPNTLGGPKRNMKGQVLRVDKTPIPRLYSAGELGSVWGMLYQGGGNIAECVAFGRIAGVNAAAEKLKK